MSEKPKEVGLTAENENQDDHEHDPHFEPIITLPEVSLPTLEEEEVELLKLRAKLFRYDTNESPPEWKERGTGDVKLLRHKEKNSVRVLMRRDKTLKICANHFVTPYMELKPNCGSDRAWVWSVVADFADETAKPELLAIKFANADNAKKWKETFEEAKQIVATKCSIYTKSPSDESENEDSSESSDEANVNGSVIENTSTVTETNKTIEVLERLNINNCGEPANASNINVVKVLNTDDPDVNKNKEEVEKSNSTSKSIS